MTTPSAPNPRNVRQLHDLPGRCALVTGGSRGLGLQMAQALGEAGARVLVSARKADELAQAVLGLKGPVLLFASDAGAYITGQLLAVDGGASAIVAD